MERRLAAILVADMFGYSRLMEADESGVIARQKAHRRELIDAEIERNRGHIVKTTGDGLLVEFASAQDAVRSAIDIQAEMLLRERDRPEDERIQYRVGINVGDVVFDDGDIFGDGVNVASRLESLAEPGGVCVSDSVYQMVQDRLSEPFRDLGSQRVKNISRAIRVWQWTPNAPVEEAEIADAALTQRVQFCVAPDDVQIAYARVGKGAPILKAPNWLNHIEYEWRSPIWGPAFAALAKNHELVRFDQRGNGLSDWDVDEISENAMVADMATVAEAAGLESFALLGISQGCAFSIRYALEHSEQVRCLVLFGGFTRGRLMRNSEDEISLYEAARTMIRAGWGSPNPAYRHFFTSTFIPDATPEQAASFDELQRVSITPENAQRIYAMNSAVDVGELARRISVPTLVMHCEGDRNCPLDEGRRMAALIPGARFVTLEGNNHVVLEGTPAFDEFIREIDAFLKEHSS
jgi:class 3 adenylate cyclase/pimeloyl-ACP methyl ester carboxylesterase